MFLPTPRFRVLLIGLFCALPMAAQQEQTPITIDLPRGQQLRLIPVQVSDNPNIFSAREIKVGNTEHPGEPLTSVRLSGTLCRGDKWYIPFAETELTRAQYAAVIGLPEPSGKEAQLPQTGLSMTEVQEFMAKLNALLPGNKSYCNSIAPYCNEKSAVAFCRLPTAVEWEFAARGGNAVSNEVFAAQTPYENSAGGKFEVCFDGGNRMPAPKAVKGHRRPNPLGLYDMLGNVSEWVSPIYYYDNQPGRSGGLLVCGGNFNTPKQVLHSSARAECRPYNEDGTEYRSETIGVRVVIGSLIRHKGMSFEDFEEQWNAFNSSLAAAEMTEEDRRKLEETQKRSEGEIRKLLTTIEQMKDELQRVLADVKEKGQENSELGMKVAELEHWLTDMPEQEKKLRQDVKAMSDNVAEAARVLQDARQMKAETAVTTIGTVCIHLNGYYTSLAAIEKLLKTQGSASSIIAQRKQQYQASVEGATGVLAKACRLFTEVSPEIADAEAERQLNLLSEENHRQYEALLIGLKYARELREKGRFPSENELKDKLLDIKD